MTDFDISAVITLHREGLLCVPSLRSFLQCCDAAEAAGFSVERLATLDRCDDFTRECFDVFAGRFQRVIPTDLGDQAAARNTAAELASGTYLAFFDGDDLWGAAWLTEAIRCTADQDPRCVWHPDVCYTFFKSDFTVSSLTPIPRPEARSGFLVHPDSRDPSFDPDALFFSNVWTSNSFALRSLYRAHPFPVFRRDEGFGIEDWSWNYRTLKAGIAHRIVPNTVHMVRIKDTGSQGTRNTTERLLPDLHPD